MPHHLMWLKTDELTYSLIDMTPYHWLHG